MSEMSMEQMLEIQEIKILRALDDSTGLFEIMIFLDKFGCGNISNFIKDLRLNQRPVYRTVERLMDLGLVTVKFENPSGRKNYRSKFYYLTENGQKIAKHLVKMFEVYSSIC